MKENSSSEISNPKSLRALMIDNSENDVFLIVRALKKGGFNTVYERVETATAMEKNLQDKQWDVILCDYKMPQFSAPSAIDVLKKTDIDIPLIIVSGSIGEDAAVECMRLGAQDYIMKGNLSRLCPAIARELEEAQVRSKQKQAEENFRRSLDDLPLGVRIVTIEGETLYANKAILDIYGYESLEELKTTPVESRYTLESFVEYEIRKEKRKRGDYTNFEYDLGIVRKNGDVRYIHVLRKDVLWNGEKQVQVLYNDITDRKQAEERFLASLREKDILLKEVHHRVKNNMQVISGLLDLPAALSGNQERRKMFRESQNRIQAMSLVHEKLYGSKDFTRIDLAGYVRTMSQDLFQSYKVNPEKIDLIVETDGNVYVDINKAIPCGLILNELISNALKHAFPGNRHGELTIIISETKNTEIEIIVRDNGLGLPDNINVCKPRSVGLHLVRGLVKNQLDGQIEFRRDAGTEIHMKFPL
jgi:PAS domain S-box-containing protein